MIFKQFIVEDSLKNRNLKSIYYYIQQQGPIKKNDLLKLTNLKQTTLVRLIDELVQYGFIYESGMEKSSGGRPPILYEIMPTSSYIIGVDISRTHVTIGLLNLKFSVVDKISFNMSKIHTSEIVIREIIEAINRFKIHYELENDDILGIGIGAVGPLDREGGIILSPESFLAPGWDNVPIVQELEEKLSLDTVLENGANSAALGEFYQSPYKEQNTLYCISGMGLRCGILANGQIVKSKIGDASSFGHMVIDIGGKECTCGNRGCLLSYMSHDSIVNTIISRLNQGEESIITEWTSHELHNITIELILEAGKLNDELVNQVVLESAYHYGIGLANMINMLHPDNIILNGHFIYEYPAYFEKVVDTAKIYTYHLNDRSHFSKGSLREDAVIVGAAIHLFKSY